MTRKIVLSSLLIAGLATAAISPAYAGGSAHWGHGSGSG